MRLKKILRDLITTAVETARAAGELTFDALPAFDVEAPKQADHGDLATNLALVLAKPVGRESLAPPAFSLEPRTPRNRKALPTNSSENFESWTMEFQHK